MNYTETRLTRRDVISHIRSLLKSLNTLENGLEQVAQAGDTQAYQQLTERHETVAKKLHTYGFTTQFTNHRNPLDRKDDQKHPQR